MKRFLRVFSIDLRSLAAFRIATGLLLLVDLINRGLYLQDHYTDFGLCLAPYLDKFANIQYFSFHLSHGSGWFQSALFVVAAFFAICMMVGYRTRLVTYFLGNAYIPTK